MNLSVIHGLRAGILAILTLSYSQKLVAQSSDCSSQWTWFSQKPGDEGAFPDTQVSYYRYTFKINEGRPIRLKVSGRFPNGRYMGYNIYNTALMDSLAGIADHEIRPDDGSENPYVSGAWSDQQSYTLLFDPLKQVISQGSTLTSPGNDGQSTGAREIWYRIYDPKDGPGSPGSVTLPKIESVDAVTGALTTCPESLQIPVPKAPQGIGQVANLPPGQDENNRIHFVHHKGLGLYANRDTHYVAARLKLRGAAEDIAIIKFHAPRSPRSMGDLNNPELLDVRYWSFCVGSALSTTTIHCLTDKDARLDGKGDVTIVIAATQPKKMPEDAHFIERPRGIIPIMIYRNLLPREGFVGDLRSIPYWEAGWPGRNTDEFSAERHIGNYAPVGRVCSVEEFTASGCQIH